ncbi:NAD-dependent epimerase/dehydratase family protein [Rheinheimera sp.]|uniref:NAD-dependent epimerase/dehydratase family protein n=1 Tax=Rheinheimera sp. TaxID=1869214 RepID=UPI00307DF23D
MKLFILGLGHVGKALAKKLKADGHQVVGSTTTAAKVAELESLVDAVVVLKGDETAKVAAAAAGCDAIIVTVAPNVRNTRTKEEREVHYEQVLVRSCASAALVCTRVIFLSSFSVYGDGGVGTAAIDELTPTANHQEPSSKYYQLAEQQVLTSALGCVLRFPDMYGAPGDFSFPQRVKMAIDYFGGKAIFSADAPLYAIHFEDVVDAVHHVIQAKLSGIFNVCDNGQVPASNKAVFDAICDQNDWPRLQFLDQIKAPLRKISAAKIYATGYQVKHPDPNASLVASALA